MNLIKIEIDENGANCIKSIKEIYIGAEMSLNNWSRWCDKNIKNNFFFTENKDYKTFLTMRNGNETEDFSCTLDMAEHLVMQMPTEKAHIYRQYLIDIKNAWNSPEQIMARALQLAQKTINSFQLQIQEMQPKVEAYNILLTANNSQDVGEVAKSFGIGRNKLFKLLRDKKFLMKNNNPYQKYIENGLFEVIEVNKTSGEWSQNFTKTMITAKGIDKIREIIQEVI